MNDHQARPAPVIRGGRGRLGRLCLKELRETLRDRRTIITLVMMPILVYPLLSIVINRFVLTSRLNPTPSFRIGVEDRQQAEALRNLIRLGDALLKDSAQPGAAAAGRSPLAPPVAGWPITEADTPGVNSRPPVMEWLGPETPGSLRDNVRLGVLDLAILVNDATALPDAPGGLSQNVILVHQAASPASMEALRYVQSRLEAVNQAFVRQQLLRLGVAPRLPTELALERSLPAAGGGAFSLAAFVPLVLILMTITGAVYPAIDVTAGERERGTMEMVVATPVPRLHLLLAKYVAVVTVALLTALANLAAMAVTLTSTGIGRVIFGQAGLSLVTMLKILALLLLFAAFFSALLLAITSFARSFKEAQAYLIPLMLMALGPGIVSMLPGLELQGWLAVMPLLNIVLLGRDVLDGTPLQFSAIVAVVSNLLYALAAIAVAAKIFGTDAILYDSQAHWSDWLRSHRRSHQPPSPASALLCLALMFPLFFWLSSLLQQLNLIPLTQRLFLSGGVTCILFGLLPVLVARLSGATLREAFSVRAASPITFLGALLLGFSLWVAAHEIFLLNIQLGLTLGADKLEAARQLAIQFRNVAPWVIVVNLGLAPAVCEELFFRGYLLSSLRPTWKPWKAIVVTSFLFGLFHVVTSQALQPERFLPSTFLGLILGWLAWRSGSVWPGILLHAVHNSFLLLMACYQDELSGWLSGFSTEAGHLPVSWMIWAGLTAAAGLALVSWSTRIQVGQGQISTRSAQASPSDVA